MAEVRLRKRKMRKCNLKVVPLAPSVSRKRITGDQANKSFSDSEVSFVFLESNFCSSSISSLNKMAETLTLSAPERSTWNGCRRVPLSGFRTELVTVCKVMLCACSKTTLAETEQRVHSEQTNIFLNQISRMINFLKICSESFFESSESALLNSTKLY